MPLKVKVYGIGPSQEVSIMTYVTMCYVVNKLLMVLLFTIRWQDSPVLARRVVISGPDLGAIQQLGECYGVG